jgi:hypothetical protein
VGILGSGANGAGGASGGYNGTQPGGSGGSGGGTGASMGRFCTLSSPVGTGGLYGGGGVFALICICGGQSGYEANGAKGAVRIIWPGCARSFPSTRTGNE